MNLEDSVDGLERSLSVKAREAISLDDFAWPEERKFPIDSQDHLDSAARLIGNAPTDKRDAIKTRAISIAKRRGFVLPDAWQSQDPHKEDRSMLPETLDFYVPIDRIDRDKREVIGVATAEVKDGHGTIFRYQGSKDAFTAWRGNLREMHSNKAVGRALEITPLDDKKQILVRARVSKGAEDTWQKVLDGTLTGFSVGAKNGKWAEDTIDGEKVPVLERYDLVELSLVDNPSCPVANVSIVRADGLAAEALASEDEEPALPAQDAQQQQETEQRNAQADDTRAGARISADTQSQLHDARNAALQSAMKMMTACGCDQCMAVLLVLDPDGDGDIDLGGLDDPDGDSTDAVAAQQQQSNDNSRALAADIVRQVKAELVAELRNQLSPTTSRVNALLARDAASRGSEQRATENPEIARRFEVLDTQITEVLGLVKKIAAQPTEGGPVLNAADKRLATQPLLHRSTDDSAAIARAMELGFSPPDGQEAQTRAAASYINRNIPR